MDDSILRDYVDIGWSVFPVKGPHYGADKDDAKRPAIAEWKAFQYRKPAEDEIATWEKEKPKASVGAVMGPITGLIAIDIDSNDWMVRFPNADFGETVKAITTRGCHFFYKWEDWLLDFSHNRAALDSIKGLDLRGQGGYVVVPNTNDEKRRWAVSPWEKRAEAMPEWLRKFLQETLAKKNSTSVEKPSLKNIAEGNRHSTFLSYVGKLHKKGFTQEEITWFLGPAAASCGFSSELEALIADVVNRYPTDATEENKVTAISATDLHDSAIQEVTERQKRGIEFVTNFPTIDERLSGIRRRELISIGAYTSHGKSLMAGTMAFELSTQGRVCYFTTEMSASQFYVLRIAPSLYSIDAQKFRHARLEDEDKIKLQNKPDVNLWFCDKPSPTLNQIREVCEQINPDVLIIDHLNRCRTEKAENRNAGIADFLIGIKSMALERNMVAIVTAQLNRMSQAAGSPGLFHFRDSGAIEMESDVAILLDKKDELGTAIEGTIAKNRHGPKAIFTLEMLPHKMAVIELNGVRP